MPDHKQFFRLPPSTAAVYVGPEGEVMVEADSWSIRVHDGITPGGTKLASVDFVAGIYATLVGVAGTTSLPELTEVGTITSGEWDAGPVTAAGAVTGTRFIATGATVGNGLHLKAADNPGLGAGTTEVANWTSAVFNITTPLVVSGALTPAANDGAALGSVAAGWSDAYFASGGFLDWNSGTARIFQSGLSLVSTVAFIATAFNPSATTGITTGLGLAATDTWGLYANTTETMRGTTTYVQISQLVGIGKTPTVALDILRTQSAVSLIRAQNASTNAAAAMGVYLLNSASTGQLVMTSTGYTPAAGILADQLYMYNSGAGGLTIQAGHATGDVTVYNRNALALTFAGSQAATFAGALTAVVHNVTGTSGIATGTALAASNTLGLYANTTEVMRATSVLITANVALAVAATTASTSTTTGALKSAGGLGVAGAGFFGGVLTATGFETDRGGPTAFTAGVAVTVASIGAGVVAIYNVYDTGATQWGAVYVTRIGGNGGPVKQELGLVGVTFSISGANLQATFTGAGAGTFSFIRTKITG